MIYYCVNMRRLTLRGIEMEMSMTIMNRIIKWIMMEHVYIYGYNVHKDYDIAYDMI